MNDRVSMRSRLCLAGLLSCLLIVGRLQAGDGACAGGDCCVQCGAGAAQPVCRLVCEEKKVPVVCWGCETEDFCVPCRSQQGCKHCEPVCDDVTDSKSPCTGPRKFVWREWLPGGAKVYTRSKLMKRTVIKKVPSYKWVIEDLCAECAAGAESVMPPPGAEIPLPPPLPGK